MTDSGFILLGQLRCRDKEPELNVEIEGTRNLSLGKLA